MVANAQTFDFCWMVPSVCGWCSPWPVCELIAVVLRDNLLFSELMVAYRMSDGRHRQSLYLLPTPSHCRYNSDFFVSDDGSTSIYLARCMCVHQTLYHGILGANKPDGLCGCLAHTCADTCLLCHCPSHCGIEHSSHVWKTKRRCVFTILGASSGTA
jgi:hypothetical protein